VAAGSEEREPQVRQLPILSLPGKAVGSLLREQIVPLPSMPIISWFISFFYHYQVNNPKNLLFKTKSTKKNDPAPIGVILYPYFTIKV